MSSETMSALRRRLPRATRPSPPRSAVGAAAIVLVALIPASAALGAIYRLNSDGIPIHRHVGIYNIKVPPFANDSQLTQEAGKALNEWASDLAGLGPETLKVQSVPGASDANLLFDRHPMGSNNVRVIETTGWARHPDKQTLATFNATYTDAMTPQYKRGYACSTIGRALGLVDAPADRDDCMSAPTQKPQVGIASVEYVDNLYGPNLTLGDLSGSLIDHRGGLTTKALVPGGARGDLSQSGSGYRLDVAARGIEIEHIEARIEGPGSQLALAFEPADFPNPEQNEHALCTPVCRTNSHAIITKDQLAAAFPNPGRYTLTVSAGDDGDTDDTFDQTASVNVPVWIDYPYFGYNDQWSKNDSNFLRTPVTPAGGALDAFHEDFSDRNPFALAEAGGSNALRYSILWQTVERCRSGVNSENELSPPADDPDHFWHFYDDLYKRAIDEGMRPIIDVHGAGTCRDAEGVSGGTLPPAYVACTSTSNHILYEPVDSPADITEPLPIKPHEIPAPAWYDDWGEFVATVAQRYDQALAIEVWNEPNAAPFWGGCEPQPSVYAELMRWAYRGVNGQITGFPGHPSTPVITAGMSPGEGQGSSERHQNPDGTPIRYVRKQNNVEYLKAVVGMLDSAGTPSYTPGSFRDGIGAHLYSSPENEIATKAIGQLRAIDSNLSPADHEPFFVTEIGASTKDDDSLPNSRRQSDALLVAYRTLRDAYENETWERDITAIIIHRMFACTTSGCGSLSGNSDDLTEYGMSVRAVPATPNTSAGNWESRGKWFEPGLSNGSTVNAFCELARLRDFEPDNHPQLDDACPAP